MKQEEKKIEDYCRQFARRRGWLVWKNEANGNKGIPDDSFLYPKTGVFLLVEFKKDKEQSPRPEQQKWLLKAPLNAVLIGSIEDFEELIIHSEKKCYEYLPHSVATIANV